MTTRVGARPGRGSLAGWRLLALALLALGAGSGCCEPEPEHWGRYDGELELRQLEDGRMMLLRDFKYADPKDTEWTAKKGDITDGASIPQFLWSFIGGPFVGPKLRAAVIHDRYCIAENREGETWEQVHRMFYEAMRCAGVGETKAKIMYGGVYHFGPRWDEAAPPPRWRTRPTPRPTLPPLEGRPADAPDRQEEIEEFQEKLEAWERSEREREAPLKKRFEAMERWIRDENPSLEQIRGRASG